MRKCEQAGAEKAYEVQNLMDAIPLLLPADRIESHPKIDEVGTLRKGLELVKSVSYKHLDLLRPSARCYSMFKGQAKHTPNREKVKYSLIKDVEDHQQGLYDKPLPCFGCGVGWFSFLSGFAFPLMWYYATFLYFGNYYRKDPRERAGLAASAIAALGFSVVLLMIVAFLLLGLK